MRLLKIYLFALLISSNQIVVAQEDATEGEAPSTVCLLYTSDAADEV